MKWGIAIVIIIAGALVYFWQQSRFDAKGARETNTQIQAEVETKTRMSEKDPEKYIPPNAVMEDGTL
ncbi:MAG: hypothetical protein A2854_04890 [Parcubacteria group bacterium RIFCSPHIGHO2_01_FULL_56_18]|nr:MAG: hypothetical protein A2854_04890 [Parcubacteria group bacterium RIFCSPHIGHO2_01_FULL_56_18]